MNPALGLGLPALKPVPLLERGFNHNPVFGGGGEVTLSELSEGSVYATLIGEAEKPTCLNCQRDGIPFDTLYNAAPSAPVVLLPGDYNDDHVVNAADYTVWRNNVGQPAGTLPGDTVGGTIGRGQYDLWKANYGATRPGAGATSNVLTADAQPAGRSWLHSVARQLAGWC